MMKSKNFWTVMKMFFVTILFTLASCTAPTNEEVSSVNTIVVSRVVLSQTPHSDPQTPSATPTSTVLPSPTPTIQPTTPVPTFTVQPTPTETPVPIPTVEDMEVTQQVLWLFETNNGCQLPCWWGITPGQTTWQTAREFLGEFDFDIYEFPRDSGSTYYGVIIPIPVEEFFGYEWELGISARNGVVEKIFANVFIENPPQGNLAPYALSSFLTTYGAPSEVWLFTYSSPYVGDELPFVATLFYAEQGIAALFGINGERQGEIVQGCIQDEPVSFLSLWSPDLNLTFEQVTNGTSELEWDYLSLEESTEMNVITFYETFRNPDNITCLKTPAELWR